MQAQNIAGLSGSKRIAMHDCLDESVENPQKKIRASHQTDVLNHLERSACNHCRWWCVVVCCFVLPVVVLLSLV